MHEAEKARLLLEAARHLNETLDPSRVYDRFHELLAEPMVRMMMSRDRVDERALRGLAAEARERCQRAEPLSPQVGGV